MSIAGFRDLHGRNVPFADLEKDYRKYLFEQPLPVLLRLAEQKTVYQDFTRRRNALGLPPITLTTSPTATLDAPRITAYARMWRKFLNPDRAMMTDLGSMGHMSLEMKARRLMESGNMQWQPELNMLWEVQPGEFMPMQIDLLEFPGETYTNIHDWKYYTGYKVKAAADPDQWEDGGKLWDVRLQLSAYASAVKEGGFRMTLDPMTWEPTGEIEQLSPTDVHKVFAHLQAKEGVDAVDEFGDSERINYARVEVDVLDIEDTRNIFTERIKRHRVSSRVGADVLSGRIGTGDAESQMPKCSAEEKWLGAGSWQIWRKASYSPKKASHYFTEDMSKPHVAKSLAYKKWEEIKNDRKKCDQYDPPRYVSAAPKRCMAWCDYAPVCSQFRREHPDEYESVQRKHALSLEMKEVKDDDND